eukprot:scaffold8276_cov62-Phaeocystis_antarctica.AAC.1
MASVVMLPGWPKAVQSRPSGGHAAWITILAIWRPPLAEAPSLHCEAQAARALLSGAQCASRAPRAMAGQRCRRQNDAFHRAELWSRVKAAALHVLN